MSNDKVKEAKHKGLQAVQAAPEPPTPTPVPGPVMPPMPPMPTAPVVNSAPTKLQDLDKMSLDLAKARKQTTLAEAKTALAENEKAELAYRYFILQLYMKYGLTASDAISEAGDIIIGGAVQQQAK
jgi:hypothetical protein